MGTKDDRVDAYIAKSADFAKPILTHIRKLVHQACPDVQETMKWSSPFFDYRGPMCNMSSFKQHCAFGFWKGALIPEIQKAGEAMGDGVYTRFSEIKSVKDLPSDKVLIDFITKAAAFNDSGIRACDVVEPVTKKADVSVPDDLMKALKKNKSAMETWKNFSPSKVREYVEWIADAKTDATRIKRLDTAVEWISEGKSRHWKYQK